MNPAERGTAARSPQAARRSLRHLGLQVTRRLDGLLHGEHLGLRAGPGSEPGEARVYQPGDDDVRRMDWSITARTTVPHIRDPVADRELECWVLLDLSASMDFGTAQVPKREVAFGALAAVHTLTQRVGDRFGAHFLHDGRILRRPARSGSAALSTLLAAAERIPDGTGAVPGGGLGLAEALDDLARARTRRGLRVVISDFLDGAAPPTQGVAWEGSIRRLAARHQVLAVEVVDPRELDLPAVGWVMMRDPESGRTREVRLSQAVRRQYAAAAAAQREHVRDALRRAGVWHLVLRTDRDWLREFARFVVEQRRTARLLARHTPAVPR